MSESTIAVATRRSIKRHFPLGSVMAKGSNNPITLHSVDDDVFVRLWSLIAETMVVTVELSRPTKEAIATLVSERNNCSVCTTAHRMFGAAANRATSVQDASEQEKGKLHQQALDYAGLVFDAMAQQKDIGELSASTGKSKRFSRLNDSAKAECALVVVLFSHMNRVVSAILGEEMSTAMFSIPRAAARVLESRGVVKVMNKIVSPLLAGAFQTKHKAGLTASLFPEEGYRGVQAPLPNHLQRVLFAGLERSNSLARIQHWVIGFEKQTLIQDQILSKNLIRFLEDPTTAPPKSCAPYLHPDQALNWAEHSLPGLMEAWGDLEDPGEQAVAWVLVLTTFAPQAVYHSTYWYTLVKFLGEDTARLIVVWWSLRHTLKSAKGLDYEIDVNAMMKKQVLRH